MESQTFAFITKPRPYTPPPVIAFEQHIKGWVNSGFNRRISTLQVQHTTVEGREEIRIEFDVSRVVGGPGREQTHTFDGGLTLTREDADELIKVLQGTFTLSPEDK